MSGNKRGEFTMQKLWYIIFCYSVRKVDLIPLAAADRPVEIYIVSLQRRYIHIFCNVKKK